jgi:hypothetical protein
MAVRQATRRYSDIGTFLDEYPSTLGVGALSLPADALSGEPAPDLKVDLVLPLVGRVGPLITQVVASLPDGGVAVRIVEIPPAADLAIRRLLELVDDVESWLVRTGRLFPVEPPEDNTEELRALRHRVAELERAPRGTADAAAYSAAPEARPRGLPVPAVEHLPPALSGSLEDRSLRDAFMALAVERQTGLFTLRHPSGKIRWGYWSKGGPVAWRTEPVEEQEVLGMLLYRAGTLSKEQLAACLDVMERSGARQGEALIELGICTFPQVVLLLQKQVDFIFQRVLREHEGTWSFHLLDELPERFLAPALRVGTLLYRTLVTHAKDMPAQELAAALRPWLDHYVTLAPGVERTVEEMKLTADEAQFVQIIQKTPYRLREVFAVSSLSRSQTAAMVWSLQDLNLLDMRLESTGVREKEDFERMLTSRRAAARASTLFERMEVHWICTGSEVEAAYARVKKEWPLDALVTRFGDGIRPALQEIHNAADEANKTLSVDGLRREYRASVIERMKIEQSAEMLGRQGEMAIMKDSAREAVACFAKAVELVPSNTEYREGLVRARMIGRP